ncbi:MAG: ATP-binding protein [Blastocatellia bacterium]
MIQKGKLAIKFIVPVTVLIIFVSIILSIIVGKVARTNLRAILEQRVEALSKNLAYNSELAVLTVNESILKNLIKGVLDQEDIVYVIVIDNKDNVLTQSEKKEFLNIIEEKKKNVNSERKYIENLQKQYFFLKKYQTEFFEVVANISTIKKSRTTEEINLEPLLTSNEEIQEVTTNEKQEKVNIGFIKIGVSTANITQTINKFILTVVIINLISVVLITVLIGLILSQVVIFPIQRLVQSMDKVAKGDFSSQVKVTSNDEVGQLALSFNTMIGFLKEAYAKLETNIQALKKEISQRQRVELMLAKQKEELLRSNEELEKFAYVASHDLQEPLRKIQAFGDRLKNKFADVIADEGKDYLERMQNASKRMQILINDLLAFSRITTKTQPFVKISLNKLVNDILSDLETLIERTKGQVELEDLPEIEADPLQMRQLFQNLINNALKFHKKDTTPIVKISAQVLNGNNTNGKLLDGYQIFIEDNGIGFDEKYLDRIFIIFQRLHGRSEYEGTGIGLAICRKIVEQHKGTITAMSVLGEGSKFILTLPKKQSQGEINDGYY